MTFDPTYKTTRVMHAYWPDHISTQDGEMRWDPVHAEDVAAELRWLADQISTPAKVAVSSLAYRPERRFYDAWGDDRFVIHVLDQGETKINLIKAIREATNLGLKESKDIADGQADYVVGDMARAEYIRAKCWNASNNSSIVIEPI